MSSSPSAIAFNRDTLALILAAYPPWRRLIPCFIPRNYPVEWTRGPLPELDDLYACCGQSAAGTIMSRFPCHEEHILENRERLLHSRVDAILIPETQTLHLPNAQLHFTLPPRSGIFNHIQRCAALAGHATGWGQPYNP